MGVDKYKKYCKTGLSTIITCSTVLHKEVFRNMREILDVSYISKFLNFNAIEHIFLVTDKHADSDFKKDLYLEYPLHYV